MSDGFELGELISLRELGRRTGLSPREVRRLRDEEALPVYQLGKRWQRVLVSEVMEWLESRRGQAPPRTNGTNARSVPGRGDGDG